MIILNQENGKKISDNVYIYNLFCNNNLLINNLILKSNIKTNITFGFIGQNKKYIFNPIYDESDTSIDINIELIKNNNYIYLYAISNKFQIKINENIILKNIKYQILDSPYIINTANYYDILIKKNTKVYFFAYINDPANDNLYEIQMNNKKLITYDKNDNFYNFIGNININNTKIFTLSVNMKYLINIIKLIVIYNNDEIIDYTNYYNNDNLYKMNPVISYNNIKIHSYYIELKLEKYDNNTRLSFDKNNKLVLKIVDNIVYLNNKKILTYDNKYIKFIFTSNYTKTDIYVFDNLPNKMQWNKKLSINLNLNFYQKLYENNYYDSHINKKIITCRKAYLFKYNDNKYIENITFQYYNIEPTILLNNYTLILGGDLNYNKKLNIKYGELNIINKNIPISINSIDNKGNKIISEHFNITSTSITSTSITSPPITSTSITSTSITSPPITSTPITSTPITSPPITSTSNIFSNIDNTIDNKNKSNNNIMGINNLNKSLNKQMKQIFMFEFNDVSIYEIFNAFIIITILILYYITSIGR